LTILYRDLLVFWRGKISEALTTLASPLTFFLVFGLGLKDYIRHVDGVPYMLFVAPGLIAMAAMSEAFEDGSWGMWFHRMIQRTIDEYRVNPITVYDIVVGKILSGFCQGALKGILVALVILPLTGFRFRIDGTGFYLVYLALGSMIFSCSGILAGTLLDKPEQVGRVYAVIVAPLIFLSGLFFPITVYPSKVQFIVKLIPTTAIFDGSRRAILNGELDPMYLVILTLFAILSFVLTVIIFDRRIEE